MRRPPVVVAPGVVAVLRATILPLAAPRTVAAHALNQDYQLPVPLWLYLWGAVGLSFVVMLVADDAPTQPATIEAA